MDEKNLDPKNSKEEKENSFDDDDDDDIEFDDNVNIEALTQQLRQHVDVGAAADMSNEDFNKEPDPPPQPVSSSPAETAPKNTVTTEKFPKINCKKYVVYISPNNVDFVDNLSLDERTEFINKIIEEKQSSDAKMQKLQKQKTYYKHLMIVCLTVIISFPLLFFAVNKSLQITITNYQQSQQNFQKLYKEKGKINSYQKFDIK